MSGKIAIATTMEPLRRYSRSSLRTMARMRRRLMFIARAASASSSISSR